ncbi:MAG: choice-of-anchor D domain-containing protein [Bacteroidetes bacterium]|nr:choice-of-anchor D domain-containing protein [Bacteroidota bacterium]
MSQQIRLFVPVLLLASFMVAHAQWSPDPAVNNAICRTGGNQNAPRIISDGKGGAIICWHDERDSQNSFDIYAQRIDKDGIVRWTVNGVPASAMWNSQAKPEMASDGMGGAIIVWTDTRDSKNDIYAQRIDSTGTILWAQDGIPVAADESNQSDAKIISDGKNGAIVTWNGNTGGFPPSSKIYAQRLGPDGTLLWSSHVLVSGKLRFSNIPSIAPDGNGGAYISYAFFPRPDYDVYAQRIDSNGTLQWQDNGIAIATGSATQDGALLAPDGAGNAFLGYLDYGGGATATLHVVILKPNGPSGSIRMTSTSGGQSGHQLSNIGTGLLGCSWEDGRVGGKTRVYAQIIDTTGAKLLAENGVEVSNRSGNQVAPFVTTDGNGGAIVSWEDKTRGTLETDICAQRISDAGSLLWSNAGVVISTAGNIRQFPQMISDGKGGAIAAWEDYRSSFSNPDIYASRILADGSLAAGPPYLTFSSKTVAFGNVGVGKSSTRDITLINVGGLPVTITSVTSSDPQFSLTPASSTIDPGSNVTATVEFQPTSKNTFSASIIVRSNSIFGPDTVAVTGSGTASAAIETDQTALNFGNVNIGETKSLVLHISNPGNDALTISSIASSNPRFTVDIASRVVEPGGSFDDTVRFTPTASGPVSADLTITSNAPSSPTIVSLSGTGTSVVTMTVDPADVSFGNVIVGETKDTTVTITNTGNDTLRISSFTSSDSRFAVVTQIRTIVPSGAVTFKLRFAPDVVGPLSTSFTIASNSVSSPDTIMAVGTGVFDPAIAFAPSALLFDTVAVGSSKDLVLTVNNTGSKTLTILGISSTNADFSALARQFDVPGGGSFSDTIRFTPSAVGKRSGMLMITSNAATSPDTVLVEGIGKDVSPVHELRALPGAFTLYQSYPNPFHHSTTIRYDLEMSAPVRLTVYNSLGQITATLVDETQRPGNYTVQWSPAGGTPGLHFYVLRVGTHETFGTMVLMK